MQAQYWRDCPLVSIDDDVVHGEPVFAGTRMPVESAIDSYYAFRELEDFSDEEAVQATLKSFPTIPSAEGLREVLAYDIAREHQLQH